MSMQVDKVRDVLLALNALREGLIDQEQLFSAVEEWVSERRRSMGDILVGSGALASPDLSRLAKAAAEGVERRLVDEDPSLTVAYEGTAHQDGRQLVDDSRPFAPGPAASSPPRFQVMRSHARGGLGEVFLAFDRELNRQVALKSIRASLAHDPDSQSRFVHEATVTGRLEHPGIVPIYGLGRYPDGRPYYAMRFIQGETLKDAINRFHGPDSPRQENGEREVAFRRLLQAMIAACNAMAYAHLRGVVHRDLKPENIMLGPFGETLVVDWGIAKSLADLEQPGDDLDPIIPGSDGSLTRTGAALGTPRYMSPEQAAGDLKKVGPASDIYGLGATLYCLLVGHAPFPDGDLSDILDRVQRGIFPAPRSLRRTIDPALEAICLKAMALKPQDRHASALELGGEIEAWLADVRYRGEQVRALNQVKGSLCRLCIERAQNLFARGMSSEGMLWLARALENVPADSRRLEAVVRASLGSWYARDRLLERSLHHRGEVHTVAFSPDGRRLATACADASARLWDVATGNPLVPDREHDGPVLALAFSPDGKSLATAGADGKLRIWNALTGKPIGKPVNHDQPITAVRFSPDGSLIATACRANVPCLWKRAQRRPVNRPTGEDTTVCSIAFNAQGSLLVTACDDGRALCWDTAKGDLLGEPLIHPGPVTSLAFHCDGQTLLTGCRDGRARLWDLARGTIARQFDLGSSVVLAGFDRSGEVVATACDNGAARLWDPESGQPIGEPLEHGSRIECLAFGPGGTILATGSRDRTVRLWDTASGLPIGPPLEHRSAVLSLDFSPDGRRLATGSADGLARCWRVAPQIPGDVERIACWVRVTTELDFDPGDAIRKLDPLVGWELRRRLHELGGPPPKIR